MNRLSRKSNEDRRGAIAVMAAVFSVVMLGMIAFAVDIGYLAAARTQLQAAADSAALAAAACTNLPRDDMVAIAQQFASANPVAGAHAQLNANNVEYGIWDVNTRTFAPSSQMCTAVRVTVRPNANQGQTSLFFGRIFGLTSVSQQASAVATCNPRDIAFVVDLSGTMNNDTDPGNTTSLNSQYAAQGYPTIGTDLIQQVYNDFGFGTYPGTTQWIGQPLGVAKSGCMTTLSSATGPLANSTIPVQYRILSTDSSSARKKKAYCWAMDVQIPQIMPNAIPTPNSTNSSSYSYWASYFNDSRTSSQTNLGYSSYLSFMMYNGRDRKPDGANYTPLSRLNASCPYHSESTADGTFSFPPREMPTHAGRRAIIAAIKLISGRNQSISDANQQDWVSIITFDSLSGGAILQPLTNNYTTAMQACTQLQAGNDSAYNTATETGLIMAANHLKPQSQGGAGRIMSNKIIVLLTDGMPNLYQSSNSTISTYESQHPGANFYGGSSFYPQDAALMQTSMVRGDNWYLYPVGIGLGCDYDFMDRMARTGATANQSGQSPRGTGNPAVYETVLTQIFQNIITNPKLRIVK
jgi:Flp pilus assembly protein TadG